MDFGFSPAGFLKFAVLSVPDSEKLKNSGKDRALLTCVANDLEAAYGTPTLEDSFGTLGFRKDGTQILLVHVEDNVGTFEIQYSDLTKSSNL
jgi:hypothetical protein